jgi:putative hydrolase of the HAD superfamily
VSPRAVIFDLWGTLATWPYERSQELYRHMARHLGADEERFVEVWRSSYHTRETGPIRAGLEAVAIELGIEEPDLEPLLRVRLDHHRQHLAPREDAVATLSALRERGKLLGLITVCTEEVEQIWEETALAPHFDATVFSCSVGMAKPDPRIYQLACEQLGVEPAESVFVGDGANQELPGAERVGMRAIQLRVPGEQRPHGADDWTGEYVETLSELLERI